MPTSAGSDSISAEVAAPTSVSRAIPASAICGWSSQAAEALPEKSCSRVSRATTSGPYVDERGATPVVSSGERRQ
jgi:hypothetical protein